VSEGAFVVVQVNSLTWTLSELVIRAKQQKMGMVHVTLLSRTFHMRMEK